MKESHKEGKAVSLQHLYRRHVYVYMYVYPYMHICVYLYACVYTYMRVCNLTMHETYSGVSVALGQEVL